MISPIINAYIAAAECPNTTTITNCFLVLLLTVYFSDHKIAHIANEVFVMRWFIDNSYPIPSS